MAFYYQDSAARAKRHFSVALRDESSRESASQWLLLLDREMAANAEPQEPASEAQPEIEATREGSGSQQVETPSENEIS
jgi:hypothetical protein